MHDFITNLYNSPLSITAQYRACMPYQDWLLLKKVIHNLYPEYDESFVKAFDENCKGSFGNIFIAKMEKFNKYCEWLFPILFELDSISNYENYSNRQKRFIGAIAERLFTLWTYHNRSKMSYMPMYYLG